jgi:hypothetical protein
VGLNVAQSQSRADLASARHLFAMKALWML